MSTVSHSFASSPGGTTSNYSPMGVSPSALSGGNAASPPGVSASPAANGAGERLEGMRREWNFRITLAHQAARALLHLIPQWESTFIPAEVVERILKEVSTNQDGDDVGDGNSPQRGAPSGRRGVERPGEINKGKSPFSSLIPWYFFNDVASSSQSSTAHLGGAAVAGGAAVVDAPRPEDVKKEVSLFYSVLPAASSSSSPVSNLEVFCAFSVQQVLSYYPAIVSIDGETNLHRLKIGKKVSGCNENLGGHPSFSFKFTTRGTTVRKAEYGIVIGTCVDHRGYVAVLRCEREAELENYYRSIFIRHFRDAAKFTVNENIAYAADCSNSVMSDAQRLFGELRYFDVDAAISFAFAMHPMHVRPDFSPTQTVGVGSISCMTCELEVYQRVEVDLLEEEDEEDDSKTNQGGFGGGHMHGGGASSHQQLSAVPGSELADIDISKYKAASAVLFVDVELVCKQGYPANMSINQYLQLKLKRLLDTFKDAKLVGEPQAGQIGPRISRSQHVTFMYEGNPRHAGVVKALMTSTLVGNHGITALYFTRLTQGLFDHHLYLFQHLVRSFAFYGEGDLRGPFSRFETRHKARLTEVELAKAYPQTVSVNEVKEGHLKALQASNDGRCDGAVVYVVDPHTMACVKKDELTQAGGTADTGGEGQLGGGSSSSPTSRTASIDRTNEALGREGSDEVPKGSPVLDDPTPISVLNVPHLASASRSAVDAGIEGQHSLGAHGDAIPDGDSDETRKKSTNVDHHHINGGPPVAGDDRGARSTEPTDFGGGARSVSDAAGFLEATNNELVDTRRSGSGGAPSPTLGNTQASLCATIGTTSVGGEGVAPSPAGDLRMHNSGGSGAELGGKEGEDEAEESAAIVSSSDARFPPPPKSSALVDEILAGEDNMYFGPSLRDLYCRCCEQVSCRPNSYLFNKLPLSSRFTEAIEEIDLSSNYLGHQGFQAILNFLEYLPKIQTLIFNDMGLDNEDLRNLCECLEKNPTVHSIQLKANPKVTLPATKHLTRLIRVNTRITTLLLSGTSLGESLIKRIEADAAANKK